MRQDPLTYLENYKGQNEFLLSVRESAAKYGSLTERQEIAVFKFMQYDRSSHRLTGQVIEIKKWLAAAIGKERNIQMFRNLLVVEVIRETERAILARVKLSAKPAVNCHVCGRHLDDELSAATGIGPTCAKKIGLERTVDRYELLKAIEELVEKVGEFELWIPISQIIGEEE